MPSLASWRLQDLIDYESFLNADERAATSDDLHRRDRAFFLETGGDPSEPPRSLLRRWLDFRRGVARRESSGGELILPSEAFNQIYELARWTLAAAGLALGWAAAAAALSYSANSEPINAITFFVEFALVQLAVLAAAFVVLAARHWFPDRRIPSLMRLALRVAASAAGSLWQRHRVRIAGARRQNAEALFGIVRARGALYGVALTWSLVILAQGFAISFNVGALGAMAARHAFHDLDFGWESTWFDAGQVSRAAAVASTPWQWALHPAHPTPEQVAGSQNRKRGATRLNPASLKSWSHFLFGAVVFYGLLPRVALLAFAVRAQRRALGRLRFGDGRSAAVLNRLHTPTVETLGLDSPERLTSPTMGWAGSASTTAPAGPPFAVMLALNLAGRQFTPEQAASAVGHPNVSAAVFQAGSLSLEDDERAFAALRAGIAKTPEAAIFALIASWTAPMIASKLLLDQLRATVGPQTLIRLALVGRPAADGGARPVRDSDRALWMSAMHARGDAYLLVL